MVSEIDMMSINENLAYHLAISPSHFNAIESEVLAALHFNVGLSEEQFQTRFKAISDLCGEQFRADQVKLAELNRPMVVSSPESGAETSDGSQVTQIDAVEANESESVISEETKKPRVVESS